MSRVAGATAPTMPSAPFSPAMASRREISTTDRVCIAASGVLLMTTVFNVVGRASLASSIQGGFIVGVIFYAAYDIYERNVLRTH